MNALVDAGAFFIIEIYTPDTLRHSTALNLHQTIKTKTMKTIKIEAFQIIGISVRTTNENGQAAKDIPQLWGKFMSEGISEKIPNKIADDIFSIYTNYESDHTKPYDTILGCKVSSLESIPDGMIGQSFEGGTFAQFVSKGDVTQGSVYQSWVDIWNTDLDRLYTADFEIYSEKAMDPTNAEVDIFVAIKE